MSEQRSRPPFLLVHGAWHGAWCWRDTLAELERRGQRAHAFDLPSHGDDPTSPHDVTLDDYARTTVEHARSLGEPVLAVGHSMGGHVISAAAERDPDAFAGLVYLCAYLPRDGDTLAALAGEDPESRINASIALGDDGLLHVKPGAAGDVFYTDCSAEQIAWATERLCPQPTRATAAPVSLSAERFGRVPRAYLECLRDAAVTIDMQRKLQAWTPCAAVAALDTGHSPFLSQPRALVDALETLAAKLAS